MSEKIGVSVYCIAYNHEKYIRKALDGFLMQKTDFNVQYIIHDDASTDGTADIIREYAEKYPDKFIPVLQTENQYSKGVNIVKTFILPMIKGKYIALCEGDDYWTDPLKLQKQYDAMEANPDCAISVHRVDHIDEDGTLNGRSQAPENIKTGIISSEKFIDTVIHDFPYQTSSYFRRTADCAEYYENLPEFCKYLSCGDDKMMLYFGQLGNVYYFDESMSHYREFSVGSWSSRTTKDSKERKLKFSRDFAAGYKAFDEYTNGKYHDSCEYGIKRYEFKEAYLNLDLKKVLLKEYRGFFNRLSFGKRIKFIIKAVLKRGK